MATLDSMMNRRQPPPPISSSSSSFSPTAHQPPSPSIVASRQTNKKKQKQEQKFRLLLPQIITLSNHNSSGGATAIARGGATGYNNHHSFTTRIIKLILVAVGPILFMRWISSGQALQRSDQNYHHQRTTTNAIVRDQQQIMVSAEEEGVLAVRVDDDDDDNDIILTIHEENNNKDDFIITNSVADSLLLPPNQSFNYIGDIDPTLPQPWPKKEVDWWVMHRKLVEDVRTSDASLPLTATARLVFVDKEERGNGKNGALSSHQPHENQPLPQPQQDFLPQLIFYGDSITEGWAGTSFGNIPSRYRMWNIDEDEQIRQLFQTTFGVKSPWGKRALKQPLILGISGSRTYDLLWRIESGEFPVSQLLNNVTDEEEERNTVLNTPPSSLSSSSFSLNKLERIYIVLIGTNNLGGGMLPAQTIKGMDAVGRTLLRLHTDTFSLTAAAPPPPAAIVLSELLPRRDNHRAINMCPPRCKNSTTLEPYSSFMPAIDAVNRALPQVVDGWRNDFPNSRIVLLSSSREDDLFSGNDGHEDKQDNSSSIHQYQHRVNCGREMFSFDNDDDDDNMFVRYMPDLLHPNFEGYELWSRCLKKGLEAVMLDSMPVEQ